MTTNIKTLTEDEKLALSNLLRNQINTHGYALPQRLAEIIRQLAIGGDMFPWQFQATEFPIEARNNSSRIDIVLKAKASDIFLLIECKRINPAISNWCFVKNKYNKSLNTQQHFVAENIEFMPTHNHNIVNMKGKGKEILFDTNHKTYNLGFEIKSSAKGDPQGKARNEDLEKSLEQACRGMNGMIELFAKEWFSSNLEVHNAMLIPVVVTTADLFGTDVDLSKSILETGNYEDSIGLTQEEWVYFQYHQTPGIKHKYYNYPTEPESVADILYREYTRTIPIVNASAFDKFLISFSPERLMD